jgi:hypothetical protein
MHSIRLTATTALPLTVRIEQQRTLSVFDADEEMLHNATISIKEGHEEGDVLEPGE